MTKKELLKLVDKFNNGTCSEAEKQILISYCEKVQLDEISNSWDADEHKEIQERIYQRITETISPAKSGESERKVKSLVSYWKIAASLLLILSFSFVAYQQFFGTEKIEFVTQSTGIGEQKTVELEDGSVILLNVGSSITYPISFENLNQRAVSIKGEAFFEVARDEQKPFVVTSGKVTTKVLGTSFNISAYGDSGKTAVSVASGKVQVATSASNFVDLAPGQQVLVDQNSTKLEVNEVSLDNVLSWKEQLILLENLSIQEAINVLGRWYDVTFVFKDEALKNCRVSGEFYFDSLENIMENLHFITQINYTKTSDNRVILSGPPCNQ
ncbi:FecR family protein [Algoriphagus sp. Y33]|uniref:FecR family protein n=1 Tax=Algoriphagus sp. Y33 TaxID=2772483 RepID=UPI001780922B|nr:FecR domain-containing protein [Algoriphagus sp. Y33]